MDCFKGEQKAQPYLTLNPNASVSAMSDGDFELHWVRQHTGAHRVEVFDHTIRQSLAADLKQKTTG